MRSSTHRGMKEQMHQGYSKMEGDTPKGSSNVLYFTLCHILCDTVENFNATALEFSGILCSISSMAKDTKDTY